MSKYMIKGGALAAASAFALFAGQASAVSMTAGDTEISVYGYAKGDLTYDVDESLGSPTAANFSNINTGAAEDDEVTGHFEAGAQQTRLGIQTTTEMDMGGDLVTRLEGDFFGPGSSLRLRHGYGQWNGVLVGQTWSTFMPVWTLPPTLDFTGPTGQIFSRQAQARYTVGGFSIALEDSSSSLANSTFDPDGVPASGDEFDAGKNGLPDIAAAFRGSAGGLDFALTGVITNLEYDTGTADDSTQGYGVTATLNGSAGAASYGVLLGMLDGANRYANAAINGNNGYIDPATGDIETVANTLANVWVDFSLSPKTNALLSVGYSDLDSDTESAANGFSQDTLMTVHTNLRHSPVKNVTYGAALIYADAENFDGTSGDATRLMFSGIYSF